MGGGGGGGGDTEQTIRYADYIETHHKNFLNRISTEVTDTYHDNPYDDFDNLDFADGFFGTGYLLSSFPSLYDMFGKFMAGLDICALSNQILENTVNSPTIDNLVNAEYTSLDDHITTKVIPKFQTGMRDINAVMTSSFVIGNSLIRSAQTTSIEKFSGELKYRMLPIAQDKWKTHLDWNSKVVREHAELLKFYISTVLDSEGHNISRQRHSRLWPFTVLEFQRAALGAMQGASNVSGGGGDEPSQASKTIGGALSGAAMGYQMGGGSYYGAAAGAVIGGAMSYL